MRDDKQAITIKREVAKAMTAEAASKSRPAKALAGIKVSNAERVIDVSTGLTKLHLVRYYESVAKWILPHLKDRPTSLVRGPTGVGGELFFQKHGDKIGIPGIRELDPALWPGHKALLVVDTPQALAGAAQLNVIEFPHGIRLPRRSSSQTV